MKKLYALAAGTLLLAATGCKNDEPAPQLPGTEVTEAPATPTYPNINAPAQTDVALDVTDFVISYENGQVITYTQSQTSAAFLVTRIKGATDVIIPSEITISGNAYTVGGFYLDSYQTIGDEVHTITIPISAGYNMQGNSTDGMTLRKFNNAFFTDLSGYGANLTGVYLQEDFPEYVSADGVIYTDDFGTLVMVPRKYAASTKTFTVPLGVTTIAENAFNKCEDLERIIVSTSVTAIRDEAFSNTKGLIALDMLPQAAPAANKEAFGTYARKATLRIPTGTKASYITSKVFETPAPEYPQPELEAPVRPTRPTGDDATPEAMEEYEKAMEKYGEDYDAYQEYLQAVKQYQEDILTWEEEKAIWETTQGYNYFEKVQEVNFSINNGGVVTPE